MAQPTSPSVNERVAEVQEIHRQAASMFLCWPTNAVDLAKKDSDLPQLISKLAQFIAQWEMKGADLAQAALSAPRVEPVAWQFEYQSNTLGGWVRKCSEVEPLRDKYHRNIIPLYASPPSQPDKEMLQRCVDMLADVPGDMLEDKLTKYIGEYMSLQLRSAQPDTGVRLPRKLTPEMACILEDCDGPENQTPQAVKALIEMYQPMWDKLAALPPDAGSRKPALDPATVEIWQSIETAPKDGTKIIFFSADKGLSGPGEAVWDVECKPGYWWAYGASGGMPCYPTHWMPLPPPPSALAGKEGA